MDSPTNLLDSYREEFQAQLRRIGNFTKHSGSLGTSHEGILRRFLQKYVPKKFAVSEGFIVKDRTESSKQCDIIIWSHLDYSAFYQEGDFVIVPADAVQAVIEVKTSLDKDELESSAGNLQSVRDSSKNIYTAVFAFESISIDSLLRHLIAESNWGQSNPVNSIFAMQGWVLQLGKDIPRENDILFWETRQRDLVQFDELLPFSLFMPSAAERSILGFNTFLWCLFMALGFDYHSMPFMFQSGIEHQGHIFAGKGVMFPSGPYDEEKALSKEFQEKFLETIRERANYQGW